MERRAAVPAGDGSRPILRVRETAEKGRRRAGPHVAEARWGLVLLLRLEGRFQEARHWLEDGFDEMTSPVETLRRLYKLDVDPFPIEGVRTALDRAGKQSPEDDRVWLAVRIWRFAWASLRKRRNGSNAVWTVGRDDPVVWRMKLECAAGRGRCRAGPAGTSALAGGPRASQIGSPRSAPGWRHAPEISRVSELALTRAIALNPTDAMALERLAVLEHEAGRSDEAARLRRGDPAPSIEIARSTSGS